jgi:nucleotide-binding universal stress UspA family protein
MEHQKTSSNRIVVGVDGSIPSDAAVAWAAQEACERGAALEVVHAWMLPLVPWSAPPTPLLTDPTGFEDAAQAILDHSMQVARVWVGDRPLEVEGRLIEGQAVQSMVDRAEGADLLVVGNRGHGGFASLLLGSVALGCAHRSTVPLAVVRGNRATPGSGDVVVGVDRSEGSLRALRWAAEEASRLGSRLVAVHGWETPWAVPPGGLAYGPVLDETFRREAGELLDKVTAEAVADLEDPPEVVCRVEPAVAPQALLTAARSAALLVVGTRGRSGLSGLFLGSVSQQCVHHAACPLVLVPVHAAETAESAS